MNAYIDFVKLTPLQKGVSCFLNASVEGRTIPSLKVSSLKSILVAHVSKHAIESNVLGKYTTACVQHTNINMQTIKMKQN